MLQKDKLLSWLRASYSKRSDLFIKSATRSGKGYAGVRGQGQDLGESTNLYDYQSWNLRMLVLGERGGSEKHLSKVFLTALKCVLA